MSHASPPASGNLVSVRERRFVVMDAQQSALGPDPLQRDSLARQHLVTLSSVEETPSAKRCRSSGRSSRARALAEKVALPTA